MFQEKPAENHSTLSEIRNRCSLARFFNGGKNVFFCIELVYSLAGRLYEEIRRTHARVTQIIRVYKRCGTRIATADTNPVCPLPISKFSPLRSPLIFCAWSLPRSATANALITLVVVVVYGKTDLSRRIIFRAKSSSKQAHTVSAVVASVTCKHNEGRKAADAITCQRFAFWCQF